MDQPMKLTEYAYANEQSRAVEKCLHILRNIMGIYEYEQNLTVKFLEGYVSAMKAIVRQAE